MPRRPELQLADVDRQAATPLRIGAERLLHPELGDPQRDFGPGRGLREFDIEPQPPVGVIVQAQEIVADVAIRRAHEHHVARDAAVVPPVESQRRNGVGRAAVVDLDGQEIVARVQAVADLHLEGGESALVGGDLLAVEIDVAAVVHSPEVEEEPLAVARCGNGRDAGSLRELRSRFPDRQMPGVPDRTLVVFELRALRVPVPGDFEPQAALEGVFEEFGVVLRRTVQEDLLGNSLIVGIDDCGPLAVQRLTVTAVDVRHRRARRQRSGRGEAEQCGRKQSMKFHRSIFQASICRVRRCFPQAATHAALPCGPRSGGCAGRRIRVRGSG